MQAIVRAQVVRRDESVEFAGAELLHRAFEVFRGRDVVPVLAERIDEGTQGLRIGIDSKHCSSSHAYQLSKSPAN
jgi:hypothetical protein